MEMGSNQEVHRQTIGSLEHQENTAQDLNSIMSIYQTAVEMADRVSQRRQSANTFGLALNSTLISVFGIFFTVKNSVPHWSWLVALTGIWESLVWWFLIKSYRQLNTAKYQIVHRIENRLPVKLYEDEWVLLHGGESKKVYWPISHIESLAPWGFIAIYLIIGLASVIHR